MSYQHFSAIYNNIKLIILLELIWEQVCVCISCVGKFYDLPTQGDIKVLAQSQYTTNKHTTPLVTLNLHLVNYSILCSLNTKYQARKLDLRVICIPPAQPQLVWTHWIPHWGRCCTTEASRWSIPCPLNEFSLHV